jgi:hypothetical protein
MSYEDFLKYFTSLEICHLCREDESHLVEWEMSSIKGRWLRGLTAGGSINDQGKQSLTFFFIFFFFFFFLWIALLLSETYCHNPQYLFTVSEVDEGDEEEDKCTLIISFMQKGRSQRKRKYLPIGFAVYEV